MNGVSVYPGPKTQNAPTWQVEKQAGRSVIFGIPGTETPSRSLTQPPLTSHTLPCTPPSCI